MPMRSFVVALILCAMPVTGHAQEPTLAQILELLEDPDVTVSFGALQRLRWQLDARRAADAPALAAVRRKLEHPSAEIRTEAAWVCARARDPLAIPSLPPPLLGS